MFATVLTTITTIWRPSFSDYISPSGCILYFHQFLNVERNCIFLRRTGVHQGFCNTVCTIGRTLIQERKADDVEQYGRRLCLRIDDVPLRASETSKDIEHELHREFTNMGLRLPEEAIDRAHHVGKRYEVEEEDEDGVVTGITKQQVIVRFTSWTHRTLVYRSRKKSKNFKFKIDLTKRRMGLLSHARRLIKDVQGIDYAFSDVNCRLNLKLCGGPFRAFNSETELASIITDLDNC